MAVSGATSPPLSDETTNSPVESWCITELSVLKCSYMWTIKNFSLLREKTGEAIESSTFSGGPKDELRWCLELYPKGFDEDSADYISIYLNLILNDRKAVRTSYKISTLNAEGEKAYGISDADVLQRNESSGNAEFIRRDVLSEESLLPGDRLILFCEVSRLNHVFSLASSN